MKKLSLISISLCLIGLLVLIGCNESQDKIMDPDLPKKSGLNNNLSKKFEFNGIPLSELRLKPRQTRRDAPEMQPIIELKKHYREQIFAVKGVHKFGVTLLNDGRLALMVSTKYPMESEINKQLPKEIEGIPVIYTVEEQMVIGNNYQPANESSALSNRPRNQSGITPSQLNFKPGDAFEAKTNNNSHCRNGTIGAYVRDVWGSNTYVLTNNHCLTVFNESNPNNIVFSPPYDCWPTNKFANFYKVKDIVFSTTARNDMDAGLAKVTHFNLINYRNKCGYTINTKSPLTAYVGMEVKICGSVSTLSGKITSVADDIIVIHEGTPFQSSRKARYEDMIRHNLPSRKGDSGSLVIGTDPFFNESGPVGLLFAGDKKNHKKSNSCHITDVFNYFNIELIDY